MPHQLAATVQYTPEEQERIAIENAKAIQQRYTMKLQDKIKGLLFGAALGAAMSLPYEQAQGRIRYEHQIKPCNLGVPIGSVNYDVENMLVLADTIVTHKKLCLYSQIVNMCQWTQATLPNVPEFLQTLFDRPVDNFTLQGFQQAWQTEFSNGLEQYWTRNNFALGRCMPLVALKDTNWSKECALTSASPVSMDAHEVIVRMLRDLINENSDDVETSLIPLHINFASSIQGQGVITQVLQNHEMNLSEKRGDALNTLFAAAFTYHNLLKIVKTTDPFVTLFSTIIGKNLSGCSSTNAVVAGAILGSFVGFNKMRTYQITSNNLNIIHNAALISQRPAQYKITRIHELSEKLALLMSGQL